MNLTIDVETTTYEKGHPFARRNRLCYAGGKPENAESVISTRASDLADLISKATRIIGFNLKFDLHWLEREGITEFKSKRIWDCQLAHYLLTGQQARFPSLDQVLTYYDLPLKLDVVKTEYWEKGIDTPDIPKEIVVEYLDADLSRTELVFQRQLEDFKQNPRLFRLFNLHCEDLKVLQEMEYNGLKCNIERCRELLSGVNTDIAKLEDELNRFHNLDCFNWDSTDHLSCFLYGGTITEERRELAGFYKSGDKIGQPRFSIKRVEHVLPRRVDPIKGSELKKDGLWSTDESNLKQLRGSKTIVGQILGRAKLKKLAESYQSLLDITVEKDWEPGELHSTLNQCIAATGRLSSSAPNQQNFADEIKQIMESSYS